MAVTRYENKNQRPRAPLLFRRFSVGADFAETVAILHNPKAVSCYHMALSMSNVFIDQSR